MELKVAEFLTPILEAFQDIQQNKAPKYKEYKLCTARYTGKTFTTMMLASLALLNNDNIAVIIMRRTFNDATNSIDEIIKGTKARFGIQLNMNMTTLTGKVGTNNLIGIPVNIEKQKNSNYKLGQTTFYNTKFVIEIYDEAHVIDSELALHASSSFRFDNTDGMKIKFWFSNPWVASDPYVKEVMDATQWTREDSENAIKGKGQNFRWVAQGDVYYGAANIYANPLLPKDLLVKAEAIKDNRTRDIYIHGLAGALTGLVYTNATLLPEYFDFDDDYDFLIAGIDIGWTQIDKSGGATVLEVFKFSYKYGISGIFEYYHHNKNGMIPEKEQREKIARELAKIFKKNKKKIFVNVDSGQGAEINKYFAQELYRIEKGMTNAIIFSNMTASDKTKWPNYDRVLQTDFLIAENKIYIDPKIQPNLYASINSATWKNRDTLSEGVAPEREHKYTDVLHAMEYSLKLIIKSAWSKWGYDEIMKK